MSELIDIIISAVDQASDTFQSIVSTADDATSSIEDMGNSANDLDSSTIDEMADSADQVGQSVEQTAEAMDDLEQETNEADNAMSSMDSLMSFQAITEYVTQLTDAMWDMADKAGNVQDSWSRLELSAEGMNIPFDQMKESVTSLSEETGRAGGQIREAFISMGAAGIGNLGSMETMFKGASAQAFILQTDVQSLADKYASLTMRSSIAERTLKGTGISIEDLSAAMGMQGATIDEINEKWANLTQDQRANILGSAALMGEGKDANDAYKDSWEGLQAQIDIAKGKIEVLFGKMILPVVIPIMQTAGRILDWLGDTISGVMDGPFGTLISVLVSGAGAFVLVLAALTAITTALPFFTLTLWPAVTASWALLAPWLPFIAIGAAIVLIIYEIGKAFGWWTDVGSMIDSVWAGIQRLWNAFINHPDVQAAISTISSALHTLWDWIQQAGQAVMDFFGINSEGNFDIVRALIDGIGVAWEIMTVPIRTAIDIITWLIDTFTWLYNTVSEVWTGIWNVIGPYVSLIVSYFGGLIDTINNFRTGQIDLYTFIVTILGQIWSGFVNFVTIVSGLLLQFASSLLQRGIQAGRNLLNGVISWLRQLPGRAYNELLKVVGRIIQAGAQWVSSVKAEARKVIDGATNTLGGIASAISSALSGVVDAFTKPFKDAWSIIKPYYDKIKGAIDTIGNAIPSFGGEAAYGGEIAPVSSNIVSTGNQTIDINHNVTLDLINVPAHIDTPTLVKAIQDREVLKALTSNSDFQSFDANVKERISLKNGRARGV